MSDRILKCDVCDTDSVGTKLYDTLGKMKDYKQLCLPCFEVKKEELFYPHLEYIYGIGIKDTRVENQEPM